MRYRNGTILGRGNFRMTDAAWIKCPDCEECFCTIHNAHAFECDCPPIEEWETDPYKP